jgi:cytochrome c peroxidase
VGLAPARPAVPTDPAADRPQVDTEDHGRGLALAGLVSALLVLALAIAALLSGCASTPRFVEEDPDAYQWDLPAGFPKPVVPKDNPMSAEKVELGERLFFDTRLSGNQTFSCASCHKPELAFTDGLARAKGSTGEIHPRGSMSLLNVAYSLSFNWGDPQKESLEEQMLVPMFGEEPVELGLAGMEKELVARLASDDDYQRMFAAAFPDARRPIKVKNIVKAIASYERSLVSGDSPYDRLVFWEDDSEFSVAARRGMELFFSHRTRCGECHAGFNFSGAVTFEGAAPARPDFHNTALYNLDGDGGYPERNRGVWEFTGEPEDMGRFRPPSLRNIELTAPYMHDGSIATLEEVIDHYAAGGRAGEGNPLKSELLSGFEISEAERNELLAFLRSLTDRRFVERTGPEVPSAERTSR